MKKYGIKMTLPAGDPMRASHLLGEDWEKIRWYASERDRDSSLKAFQNKHLYSRMGDTPSLVFACIEQ